MLDTLDILIGLVTVYLAVALVVTAMVELAATVLSLRSKNLGTALTELLSDSGEDREGSIKAFYDHPLVQSLSSGRTGRPSYIPQHIVSRVVEEIVTAKTATTELWEAVDKMRPGRLQGILKSYAREAREGGQALRNGIESHYDAVMERASGWYKRKTQTLSLIAALTLVVLGNIDTIAIVRALSEDPALRAEMLVQASRLQEEAGRQLVTAANGASGVGGDAQIARLKADASDLGQAMSLATSDLKSTGLPIGWRGAPLSVPTSPLDQLLALLEKLMGWLISAFAISLGAPFWFDVLQRFMRVRASGASPQAPRAPETKPA